MLRSLVTPFDQKCRNRGGRGVQTPQILANQLTLSQPGGADYAHQSNTRPPPTHRFSDLPTYLLIRVTKVVADHGSKFSGQ